MLSILKLKLLVLMRKMHDCSIICIFVCFPQPLCLLSNLASQRPVLRGNASHTSITFMPFVSTIPTYYMVFSAIPSKYFMCYL